LSDIKLCAPCLFGLEGLVSNEAKFLGFDNVSALDGRVFMNSDEKGIAKANIHFSFAERVLTVMGEQKALSFDELFEFTKSLPWEQYITKIDAFPVKGHSVKSKLFSVPDCQSIIKKAIVERLKNKYHVEWFTETGATVQIQFQIMKDNAILMIDTSGVGLHKRGYRPTAGVAPLRETLAAAMVDITRHKYNSPLIDPLCGSGTILIEAALRGARIAPGLYRRFAFENWSAFNNDITAEVRREAKSRIKTDADFMLYGIDIDESCIETAKINAKKAKIDKYILFEVNDMRKFDFTKFEAGTVVTNPPYGERLMDIESARELYKAMGESASVNANLKWYVISPDDEFEQCFGCKADKKRKMYNGMIKCDLYQYFK